MLPLVRVDASPCTTAFRLETRLFLGRVNGSKVVFIISIVIIVFIQGRRSVASICQPLELNSIVFLSHGMF
jgi:hypothetical protein